MLSASENQQSSERFQLFLQENALEHRTPISARVILDSLATTSHVRKVAMVWKYPKFFHGDVMTYRVLSRNAASSRAIPVSRMLDIVTNHPAMPCFWGANQKGMRADGELEPEQKKQAKEVWERLRLYTIEQVKELNQLGLHKQLANRPMEWFFPMETLISTTDIDNLLAQRCHPDAQPEFQLLAGLALEALNKSIPQLLGLEEWHTPFIRPEEHFELEDRKQISVARCARISYLNHEGKLATREEDLGIYQKVAHADPIHASPFEHVSTPAMTRSVRSGNLRGWIQLRKLIPNEVVERYKPYKRFGHRTCAVCDGDGCGNCYQRGFWA